ncbi:MAG: hypothetical protein J6T19_00375 [Paludibacteraceae bacterium]|nr:hypothetical protein [Paludibacteraceae bacterium]
MKKLFANTFFAVVLLVTASCKPGPNPPTPENLSGNVSAPAWTNPAEYDYSSSMTSVIKVDLLSSYPEAAKDWVLSPNDRLAAFMGDVCCGVIEPTDDLFFLYITEPEGATDTQVSLRYYSAFYKNLFEVKNAFVFQNDSHQGSVTNPLTPTFTVIKNQ